MKKLEDEIYNNFQFEKILSKKIFQSKKPGVNLKEKK